MTSLATFPSLADDRLNYVSLCEGWCHCFRDPDRYFPEGTPLAPLTESDFLDPSTVSPETAAEHARPLADREFDFVYVCRPGHERAKNWPLARVCVERLCLDFGLKGILVGRVLIPDLSSTKNLVIRGYLKRSELLRIFAQSRTLLVTSVLDASPRILSEAMAMNTPILVNRHIIGGWHYVATETGCFFEDGNDVGAAFQAIHGQRLRPRAWFLERFGPNHSGAKLSRFVDSLCHDWGCTEPLLLSDHAVWP